jgi:peptidoglycan/LPS O-acetylase OafA/YrhL
MVAANLTMLPSFLGFPFVDDVYWTLEVELRFYFLVFLVLVTRNQQRIEALLLAWLGVLVICAFVDAPWILRVLFIEGFGQYFVAGALFYLVRTSGWSPIRAAAIVVACAMCVSHAYASRGGFITPDDTSAVVVPGIVLLCFAYFLNIVRGSRQNRFATLAERVGAVTYPLYLTHASTGHVALALLIPVFGPIGGVLIAILIALLLALLLTRVVDQPARRPVAQILSRAWRKLAAN